jgi:hypothetical protein
LSPFPTHHVTEALIAWRAIRQTIWLALDVHDGVAGRVEHLPAAPGMHRLKKQCGFLVLRKNGIDQNKHCIFCLTVFYLKIYACTNKTIGVTAM